MSLAKIPIWKKVTVIFSINLGFTLGVFFLYIKYNPTILPENKATFIGSLIASMVLFTCAMLYVLARVINKNLIKIMRRIEDSTIKLKVDSITMGQNSSVLNSASIKQASSLQETVSSIDEISSMVQRNADAATASTQVSKKSTQTAIKGKNIIDQMISSIQDISTSISDMLKEMEVSNDQISKIVNLISEIGEKTKIINDIVFQTKLLSFNASVEAARAGEHGKGFAVVAEEVGNLAAMSGKAALEIQEMLDNSIRRVTSIVGETKSKMDSLSRTGKEKMEHGSITAKECGSSLDEILVNVSSVNELIQEIATACMEQATGIKEVTKAMQELDKATNQNSSIASQSNSMSTNMKFQVDLLKDATDELVELIGISTVKSRNITSMDKQDLENHHHAALHPEKDFSKVKKETTQEHHNNNHHHRPAVHHKHDSKNIVPSESDPRFQDL